MEKLKLLQISSRFNSVKSLPTWITSLGTWAEQLKIIREALGMTQKQLAKRIKSTQIVISKHENAESNPTLETMDKIASSLGCKLIIAMIPQKELDKTIDELATKKANALIAQSLANSAMELQKPNEKVTKLSKETLRSDLIENKRTLLWED